jgi:hypothetical protein
MGRHVPRRVTVSPTSVHDLRLITSEALCRERLHGCASVLGFSKLSARDYLEKPSALEGEAAAAGASLMDLLATADILALLLDHLDTDRSKSALAAVCKTALAEQRRIRPQAEVRARTSLPVLLGARRAGWRVSHCHVDKRSGDWTPRGNGPDSDSFSDLELLSVVGRPDCALLVLSPFTALATMSHMRVLEFDTCAIGDAGVAVLAAAFRAGSMASLEVCARSHRAGMPHPRAPPVCPVLVPPCMSRPHGHLQCSTVQHGRRLCARGGSVGSSDPPCACLAAPSLPHGVQILDLRSNQIGDAGVESLLGAAKGRGALERLHTLGLDYNRVSAAGLRMLASALAAGCFGELRFMYVDDCDHAELVTAATARGIKLQKW